MITFLYLDSLFHFSIELIFRFVIKDWVFVNLEPHVVSLHSSGFVHYIARIALESSLFHMSAVLEKS